MPHRFPTLFFMVFLGVSIVTGCAKHEPPTGRRASRQDGYRVLFVGDVYFGTSYRGLEERTLR